MEHGKNWQQLPNSPKDTRKSSLLKQEIMELQLQLESQILMRQALEKELNREISVLELQVVSLETYLMSLQKQRSSHSETESPESAKPKLGEGVVVGRTDDSRSVSSSRSSFRFALPRVATKHNVVERCYSSLSQPFATSAAISRAMESCHYSLPLSMLEDGGFGDGGMEITSPNWVSEEMVKCMSSIYCELSQPSLLGEQYSSPTSSRFGGLSEVRWMDIDSGKLQGVQHKMQHFRSLVSRLESVELEDMMKHGEKLAFWINVHNSLVMHAFLVYGIPRNHVRRMSLALKASCNVGGHIVSVETIQSSILGCHIPRPRQWLGALLHPWKKLKIRDSRQDYSINTHEPRLYFALCTGNHSDPALRVYAPETVFEDLEVAKQEYIETSSVLNHKGKRMVMFLPKIVERFAKESNLGGSALVDTELDHLLPSWERTVRCKPLVVRWIPHSFEFRYLISRDSI